MTFVSAALAESTLPGLSRFRRLWRHCIESAQAENCSTRPHRPEIAESRDQTSARTRSAAHR
jgi:hypothetical protein